MPLEQELVSSLASRLLASRSTRTQRLERRMEVEILEKAQVYQPEQQR